MEMLQRLRSDGTLINPENSKRAYPTPTVMRDIYMNMIALRMMHIEGSKRGHSDEMTLFIGRPGQEAAEVATVFALPEDVWIGAYGGSWGPAIPRGISKKAIMDLHYGNPDPNTTREFLRNKMLPPYVVVSIHLPHLVGMSWKYKILDKINKPVAIYFGDGAVAGGDFHEALTWASIFKIPALFLCENNGLAISTHWQMQTATTTIAEKALAYGMRFILADGNDPLAVYAATKEAYEQATLDGVPWLVEFRHPPRVGEHTTAVIKDAPRSAEEIKETADRDPLRRTQLLLFSKEGQNLFPIDWSRHRNEERYEAVLAEINRREEDVFRHTNIKIRPEDKLLYVEALNEAKTAADCSYRELALKLEAGEGEKIIAAAVSIHETPRVDSYYVGLARRTTPDKYPAPFEGKIAGQDVIPAAVRDAMEADSRIVYFGEDVREIGGVMNLTALHLNFVGQDDFIKNRVPNFEEIALKFHKRLPLKNVFPDRIFDTPLAEAAIVGVGLGLALAGARPVMEIQFSGFLWLLMKHVQEYSRMMQRCAGLVSLPGVIIAPFGSGERIEFHRENETPAFLNNPGLIVVCPADIQDQYDMLLAAFASNKPVLYFWHIGLQRLPVIDRLIRRPPQKPIEGFGTRIAKEGTDLTVVTYGKLVHESLAIAKKLEESEKISAEVLDLRVLNPLNWSTIAESVQKTGKLITIDEGPMQLNIGAEIAARVARSAVIADLRAPVEALAAPRAHFPPSKFHNFYNPNEEKITKAIIALAKTNAW